MDARLYLAARDGDLGTLIHLANVNPDILRSMAPQGNNILHITASAARQEHKHIDFVRETMRRCPSLIDQANDHGDTPLHCAARTGQVGIVKLLMGQVDRTSLRRINSMGNTVLIEAITNCHDEVVMKLLEMDHSINDSAQRLEEMKVLIRTTDNDGQNALHHAARRNDNESIVRQLLDIEPLLAYVLNNDGDSPLHIAATFGSANTFELLVKKFPDAIEQIDRSGRNAFQISAMSGWYDPILRTWRSSPQLHSAIKEADKKYGNSLLHLAVIHHNITLAAILVTNEMVDLAIKNKDGYTALDLVYLREEEDEIQPIKRTWRFSPQLDSAITEADKKYGNSLLHLAVIHHNIALAKLLVRWEMVDLAMVNKDGYTALDLVELRAEEDEIQRQLLSIFKHKKEFHGWRRRPSLPTKITSYNDEAFRTQYNTCIVVATLITTVTFAATFTMPGGYNSGSNDNGSLGNNSSSNDNGGLGTALLANRPVFKAFLIFNTLAIAFSLCAVRCYMFGMMSPFSTKIICLHGAGLLMNLGLFSMMLPVMTAVYTVVGPVNPWLAIFVCFIGSTPPLFILSVFDWVDYIAEFFITAS